MSDYESVKKIQSLQQRIELFTGKSYSDLTSAVQALKNGYGSSEGGDSGIIDVTELPTSGIDENAVYRVTENVQVEKTEAYMVSNGDVVALTDIMLNNGIPASNMHIYVVDELPADMKPSDVETFTELHTYLLRTDGKGYMNISGYGVITLAIMFYQDPSYDKGFTENVYAETEDGIYTTLESYKRIERYFVRESGEWKEITAYVKLITPHGLEYPDLVSGDLTTRMFCIADMISGNLKEINESMFLNRDGSYVTFLRQSIFANLDIETVTIPHFINDLYYRCISSCSNLTTVTFERTSSIIIDTTTFDYCFNLTTINVPWSEGEVAGAPWGATNATINYNYTGE